MKFKHDNFEEVEHMTVWHLTPEAFQKYNPLEPSEPANFPDDFRQVAKVRGNNLNDAYRYTNTIYRKWWENDPSIVVPVFEEDMCRSTTVGDVILTWENLIMQITPTGVTEIGMLIDDPPAIIRGRRSEANRAALSVASWGGETPND